jgi:hypothetical protein
VTTDIDGRIRHPLHPDIGAIENVSFRGRRRYLPIIDTTRMWRHLLRAEESLDTLRFWTSTDTTFIFYYSYRTIHSTHDVPWFGHVTGIDRGYIREDRLGRIFLRRPVWLWEAEHGDRTHQDRDHLLYDFHASPGDTLEIASHETLGTDSVVVASVDSVSIGGVVRRRVRVEELPYWRGTGWYPPRPGILDEWVEGIGSTMRGIVPSNLEGDRLISGELLCLKIGGKRLLGLECDEHPDDARDLRIYADSGDPRMIFTDSTVALFVAPDREYKAWISAAGGQLLLEREGRGAGIVARRSEFPQESYWWVIELPGRVHYYGRVPKRE